SLPPSLLLPQ
ncbi:ubiquitin carboxyl-terminal hydrolase 16-like, partial [Nannochloropsis oceanica]